MFISGFAIKWQQFFPVTWKMPRVQVLPERKQKTMVSSGAELARPHQLSMITSVRPLMHIVKDFDNLHKVDILSA